MSTKNHTALAGIYQIRNLVNGKLYIGSAINLKQRWVDHRKTLSKGIHANERIQRAWDKYGEDNFVFEILEEVEDPAELLAREQEYLDLHRAFEREVGYNICSVAGSLLGTKRSDEVKAKFAEITRRRFEDRPELREMLSSLRRGTTLSDEHKAKISEGGKGHIVSEETRAKISAAQKGRPKNPESIAKMAEKMRGRKLTEEHKAKVSAGGKGRKLSEETKAKMSAAAKGRVIGPEQREKLRHANLGKKQSPETIAKRMAAIAAKDLPPDYYKKLSDAGVAARKAKKSADEIETPIS